jgi:hypothetical protein
MFEFARQKSFLLQSGIAKKELSSLLVQAGQGIVLPWHC